jgi:hypothetical protein
MERLEHVTAWSRASSAQIMSALCGGANGSRALLSRFLVVPNLYPSMSCRHELPDALKETILEHFSAVSRQIHRELISPPD